MPCDHCIQSGFVNLELYKIGYIVGWFIIIAYEVWSVWDELSALKYPYWSNFISGSMVFDFLKKEQVARQWYFFWATLVGTFIPIRGRDSRSNRLSNQILVGGRGKVLRVRKDGPSLIFSCLWNWYSTKEKWPFVLYQFHRQIPLYFRMSSH